CVVGIEGEDEAAVVCHIPYETRAAPVKIVVAVRVTKSVLLPMGVVEIIAEPTERAVDLCVVAIIAVAAKHILRAEMKRRVLPRHFHHEIEGPAGLRPELECRAGSNE